MNKPNYSTHNPKEINLHTHSYYCGHGSGQLIDFVNKAKEIGLTALGFSEHCPLYDEKWEGTRMPFSLLDTYMQECRSIQESEKELAIVCGFECDHHPNYTSWYKDNLLDNNFADYLALAVHFLVDVDGYEKYVGDLSFTKKMLHSYTDAYIDGIQSQLYLFGVHPDIFGMFYTKWDDEAIACSKAIFEAAVDSNVALEINGYGYRRGKIKAAEGYRFQYPMYNFWNLAKEYDLDIILNSDAHMPSDLDLTDVEVYQLIDDLQLELPSWEISKDEHYNLKIVKETSQNKKASAL